MPVMPNAKMSKLTSFSEDKLYRNEKHIYWSVRRDVYQNLEKIINNFLCICCMASLKKILRRIILMYCAKNGYGISGNKRCGSHQSLMLRVHPQYYDNENYTSAAIQNANPELKWRKLQCLILELTIVY